MKNSPQDELAQNDWNDDVNRRKQTVSLPSHESIVQRSVWKQKWRRIEKLSQQNRLSKFCTDSSLQLKSNSIFMTKDTEEFSQFTDLVANREHALSKHADSIDSKGWIRGNTKIGFALEVATCCP